MDTHRREADAEAITAVPLTPAQITGLEAALATKFGVKVRLTTRVDEKLLGGLVVRVGDKLIDGSVSTRLHALSDQLKRTKVA